MIWVILLAGGCGLRLARETQRRFGYAKPKQYCDFGGGTLLELTLGRARRFAPDRRIVVITTAKHRGDAAVVMSRHPRVVHLEQPRSRDTTAGILLPLLQVCASDPTATVIIMPTDHALADDEMFSTALIEGLELVRASEEDIALIASEPSEKDGADGASRLDDGYGWVAPVQGGGRWPRVAHFREKPPHEELAGLREAGALINTFVLVARAATLESVLALWAPDSLQFMRAAVRDPALLEVTFDLMPDSNFSRDVLENIHDQLRIVALPRAAGWTDIGTPERLAAAGWGAREPASEPRSWPSTSP